MTKLVPSHVVVPEFLGPGAVEFLQGLAETQELEGADSLSGRYKDNCLQGYVHSDEMERVFTTLGRQMNAQHWDFTIAKERPIRSKIRLLDYQASKQAHFPAHCDYMPHIPEEINGGLFEKITVVVLIKAAEEGGIFRLYNHLNVPLLEGDAIVFPSYALHEVTPILKGRRISLAGWLCGPAFR